MNMLPVTNLQEYKTLVRQLHWMGNIVAEELEQAQQQGNLRDAHDLMPVLLDISNVVGYLYSTPGNLHSKLSPVQFQENVKEVTDAARAAESDLESRFEQFADELKESDADAFSAIFFRWFQKRAIARDKHEAAGEALRNVVAQ